jgi:hypothetical protein
MLTKVLLGALLTNGFIPMVANDITVEGVPIVGLSAPAILAIFFIMFMRGDIVPGKVHRERVGDYKEEATHWRQAHGVSEEARITALKQVDVLTEGFRTVDSIAEGIRSVAREK